MLSDNKINKLKPKPTAYKVADRDGLYLYISKTGTKSFRFDYTNRHGKRKTATLGQYPVLSVDDARVLLNTAKRNILLSGDIADDTPTLEILIADFIRAKTTDKSKAEYYALKYIVPRLGKLNIVDIKVKDIALFLTTLEKITKGDAALRCGSILHRAFNFAIACGLLEYNPAATYKDICKTVTYGHYKAVLDLPILRSIYSAAAKGNGITHKAILLQMLCATRAGDLLSIKWQEVDLVNKEIKYTTKKQSVPSIIPLSVQAVSIIASLPVSGDLMLPIRRDSMLTTLRRLNVDTEQTALHGFRASFRTIMAELNAPVYALESQLSHAVPDANGRAYNRTQYLDQRRVILQEWADLLSESIK